MKLFQLASIVSVALLTCLSDPAIGIAQEGSANATMKALINDAAESAKASVFNVKDYGTVGDGKALETAALQKAIDACHQAGGGILRVPAGDYLTGTIHLKSNVNFSLDKNARILGSTNIKDYPVDDLIQPRENGPWCLIYAENSNNITISGLGEIDGQGDSKNFLRTRGPKGEMSKRPRLLRMVNCDGLTFSGVTYRRPAFWGLHLIDSRNIHFDAVTIRFRNNNYNNDGLDIDGCEDVLIENCDIDSGDDAICLKSTKNPCRNFIVRNCRVTSGTAALKCGTSSRGGFINLQVSNCYFYDCPMGAIKLQIVDGGLMDGVDISRITMDNVGSPIFIRLGNRGRTYTKGIEGIQSADVQPEGAPIGVVKNIRIKDVVAKVSLAGPDLKPHAYHPQKTGKKSQKDLDRDFAMAGPIMIAGIPDHLIENVVLENIQVSYPGGGTQQDSKREVAEDIARYPEQYFFGRLPAWGAYIRHAKNVQFKNVQLETRGPDARDKIVLDDAEGFVQQ